MKARHNKKRNSAFVYEALIKEATVAIMKKDTARKETAARLIKKYFQPGTLLRKDLDCYRSLYENQDLDRLTSEKILKEVKLQKRLIDPEGLFKQQSELIRDVNSDLSTAVFHNFVPNYKTLATIAQIFASKISPKDQVILENIIVADMIKKGEEHNSPVSIDNVVYRTFVEKFNAKYENGLLQEQKELLTHYITSFVDNALELKIYLNDEIARLKEQLEKAKEVKEIKSDEAMFKKTNDVITRLNSYAQETITEDVLMTVLKTQALVKEIYTDASND
jgi:hypothetical protein|tara:strand:+ start:1295 stop:2128 length:834 start_codon:yes stop_codon:yes gene_type:complete